MSIQPVASIPVAPPVIGRPKLAAFMFERGLSIDDIAPVIGHSREYVRQIILPWDHPLRREPKLSVIEILATWSVGEITAADWVAPLNGAPQ